MAFLISSFKNLKRALLEKSVGSFNLVFWFQQWAVRSFWEAFKQGSKTITLLYCLHVASGSEFLNTEVPFSYPD